MKLTLSFLLIFISAHASAASFNCYRARTPIEKMICTNAHLSEVDSLLGASYKRLQNSLPTSEAARLRIHQREWLNRRDSNCSPANDGCLMIMYKERLDALYQGEIENFQRSPDYADAPSAAIRGRYTLDHSRILVVTPLSRQLALLTVSGTNRMVCRFSGVGKIKNNTIIINDKGSKLRFAFSKGSARISGKNAEAYCGDESTIAGIYTSSPQAAADAGIAGTGHSGSYKLEPGYCSGDIEIKQQDNRISAVIDTVCGASYHLCHFEGSGKLTNNSAILYASDDDTNEKPITIYLETGSVRISERHNNYWCGLNAAMNGTYHKMNN
ncbi:MAG: DUF1311 domain-containing protein [Gammaproteobacteria bacterium]|nr:DUF1311 domain-containing protein [Gammaproteobacteria bacterium]